LVLRYYDECISRMAIQVLLGKQALFR